MGLLHEFKSFALRGNVVDLAVAFIMGAAFQGVVTSMVQDVMMPPLGYFTTGTDFKDQYATLAPQSRIDQLVKDGKLPKLDPKGKYTLAQMKVAGVPVLGYGALGTALINFLIVAFAVFLLVKSMTYAMKKSNVTLGPPPPEAPPQEKLLAEIRDLLKARAV